MRIYIPILVLVCLTLAGCSGGKEETKKFIDQKEALILDISKKLEANPTTAGVDEAQKLVDAQKDSLQAQRQALFKAKVSNDALLMLTDSDISEGKFFQDIGVKLTMACKDNCDAVRSKYTALERSFHAATHLEGEI